MHKLYQIYRPITATPFKQDLGYCEMAPCAALRPYIRCFWGSRGPVVRTPAEISLVIPDTCMDVIFDVNYTQNSCCANFCGINDTAFYAQETPGRDLIATFGIRFYPWAVALFAEDMLNGSKNQFWEADRLFPKLCAWMQPYLFAGMDLARLAEVAENGLMRTLCEKQMDVRFLQCVWEILTARGTCKTADIAATNAMSSRQMQRLFHTQAGLSPKTFSTLVRYQFLLSDLLFLPAFDMQDAVLKYGFTDQAHLLNNFKKFHKMTPAAAKRLAARHG